MEVVLTGITAWAGHAPKAPPSLLYHPLRPRCPALLPHESAWKRGEAAGLTIDDLLPVNLPLAQPGHHVLAHCVLPVLGIWLWLQVRQLAQIVF